MRIRHVRQGVKVFGILLLALSMISVSVAEETVAQDDYKMPGVDTGPVVKRPTDPHFDPTNEKEVRAEFEEKMAVGSEELAEQIKEYVILTENNLAFRWRGLSYFADVAKDYQAATDAGEDFYMDQDDLETLSKGVRKMLDLRLRLYKTVNLYRVIVPFHAEDTILIDEETPGFWDWNNWTGYYEVTTGTEKGRRFIKKLGLSLSAALTLYDNYFLLISLYENMGIIRRKINQGNSSYSIPQDILDEISEGIRDIGYRRGIREALKLFDRYVELRGKRTEKTGDESLDYLISTINQSKSAELFRKSVAERSWTMLGKRIKEGLFYGVRDRRKGAGRLFTNSLSKVFGNAVGLIEFRKGYLYGEKGAEKQITDNLKPLDILFEKTPFRPTDRFIPGHWGHVAIWIGSKSDLEKDGMWEKVINTWEWSNIANDRKREIEDHLSQGEVILEALRPGVQLNSLAHFLNVDDFAAVRPTYTLMLSEEEKAQTIARALSHYGKKYDFNFDVSTVDKIVCSELAFQTYLGIDWPTEKTMGRYSITPDQVAVLGQEGVPFQVVELWHQGNRVNGTPTVLDYSYQSLMWDSTLDLEGTGFWEARPVEDKSQGSEIEYDL